MSKHCGVPGLRLGYCYTVNRPALERLRRELPVWNINSLAEYFLSLLPPTDADYHRARKRLMRDMAAWQAALSRIPGFHVYPSGCNFLLVKAENGWTARRLQETLLRRFKLYVRDCSNKVGMDRYHIRVASQGAAKDRKLVRALRAISRETVP
jgi:threonine-phosphate decarboxylase